jgi:hypothetical protein
LALQPKENQAVTADYIRRAHNLQTVIDGYGSALSMAIMRFQQRRASFAAESKPGCHKAIPGHPCLGRVTCLNIGIIAPVPPSGFVLLRRYYVKIL